LAAFPPELVGDLLLRLVLAEQAPDRLGQIDKGCRFGSLIGVALGGVPRTREDSTPVDLARWHCMLADEECVKSRKRRTEEAIKANPNACRCVPNSPMRSGTNYCKIRFA
jgi:hypothetical protein